MPKHRPRVLFLLKRRHGYGYGHDHHPHGVLAFSSGLYNSAKFAEQLLSRNGYNTKLVEVTDGNDIDREVHQFKPQVVVIEALWVTPEKLAEVQRLHRKVKFVVRLHSEIPFLALEGCAMLWLRGYWEIPNVYVAVNTQQALMDMWAIERATDARENMLLLPTYYPPVRQQRKTPERCHVLRVICPGAIRPLKNQFTQAVAAMRYAEDHGKRLAFFINSTRSEQGGDSVFKNVVNLFKNTRHELHKIDWLDHADFLKLLKSMDIGLQVSFSETFNICAADLVSCGVPLVVSPQVTWVSRFVQADPTDTQDIADKMSRALVFSGLLDILNFHGLQEHSEFAKENWLREMAALT